MSDAEKTDEGSDEGQHTFSPEDLRRLETWTAPSPPAGFTARVMDTARARQSHASAPTTATGRRGSTAIPARMRTDSHRRRRRRFAMAALLGAVAVSAGGVFVASQTGSGGAQTAGGAMTVYLAALAFGGVLLIASLAGGHGDADHDAGGHPVGHGLHHAHDDPHGAESDSAAHAALVLPFLSLRFWIFGLTFFGLTGAILHGFGLASPVVAAFIASTLGVAMGYGAAQIFQRLARETVGQIAADGGHIGREGKLLLPTAKGQRGKMRVLANGVAIDLLTETDEELPLPAGSTVLIVGIRGTVVLVERSPTPTESTEQGEQT